jgi:hypothetical protein
MKLRALAVGGALAVATIAMGGDARADETKWYGWQTLTSDGTTLAATGITALAFKAEGYAPAIVFLAGYLVPSPIIHAAHGNGIAALGSVGLRVGMPGLGILAGAAIGSGLLEQFAWAVVLGGIGAAGAIAIDAAVLGYEDVPSPSPSSPPQGSAPRVLQFGGTF